ncbi:hypothetical protein [Streptomyces sp. NPDC058603]|uniref:hypothetical protein n=1 Tax=unclassified Streptomyces TaxID=2593676 RepID=UPI00365D1C8C
MTRGASAGLLALGSEIWTDGHRWTQEYKGGAPTAAVADALFSVLMGEDVEARRSFIQRNAKDVRFLDI